MGSCHKQSRGGAPPSSIVTTTALVLAAENPEYHISPSWLGFGFLGVIYVSLIVAIFLALSVASCYYSTTCFVDDDDNNNAEDENATSFAFRTEQPEGQSELDASSSGKIADPTQGAEATRVMLPSWASSASASSLPNEQNSYPPYEQHSYPPYPPGSSSSMTGVIDNNDGYPYQFPSTQTRYDGVEGTELPSHLRTSSSSMSTSSFISMSSMTGDNGYEYRIPFRDGAEGAQLTIHSRASSSSSMTGDYYAYDINPAARPPGPENEYSFVPSSARSSGTSAQRLPFTQSSRLPLNQLPGLPPPARSVYTYHSQSGPVASLQISTQATQTTSKKRGRSPSLASDRSASDPVPAEAPQGKKAKRSRSKKGAEATKKYGTKAGIHVARLPTSTLEGENRLTVEVDVGTFKKDELTEYCKGYFLPTGNRTLMIDALMAYAEAGDWSNLEPVARRKHKGQAPGSVPTTVTKRRAAAIASGAIAEPAPLIATRLPADSSLVPEPSVQESAGLLAMCDKFVQLHPFLPRSERLPPKRKSDAEWKTEMSAQLQSLTATNQLLVQQLCAQSGAVPSNSVSLLPPGASSVPNSIGWDAASAQTDKPMTPSQSNPLVPPPSPPVCLPQDIEPAETAPAETKTDGPPETPPPPGLFWAKTSYTKMVWTALPIPPNHEFFHFREPKSGLDRLLAHWDPSLPYWKPDPTWPKLPDGSFLACVNYPAVYKKTIFWREKSKVNQRGDFCHWKLLVQEYMRLGRDEFWATYSHDGTPLAKATILDLLHQKAVQDAEVIKQKFGARFSEFFTYGPKRTVYTAARHIIAYYNAHPEFDAQL
ncbi:hypothetical protein C8R46DRAFT_1208367 [Mycena filopes]|nr:hypothetical protein C8R46DRAFT_1208367 [Mycena filopes]